ncbi:MAG: glycosyltransferase family 2 protein [Candidatus Erginobacter occultus]|nr:glycosyltransferase family 2 protein [Candidatus Erginobacter occultus]
MMSLPSSQPDLSICIVAYNVRAVLKDCLQSIRRAGPEINYEVLVVDNSSRDGTGEMVKSDFPEFFLILNDSNIGFSAASNQAIRLSRGRYLLLLNPDTLVAKGALEEMVRFLDCRPAAGGGGPKLLNPDGRLQFSVRAFPTIASAFQQFTILGELGCFRRARNDYLQSGFDYARPTTVDQPMGAALFLRREALDEVGLLDEGFFLYFEEVDLCRRLTGAGWALWYNPAAEIVHLGGESTGQEGGRALYYFYQSQFRYFEKVFPPSRARIFKLAFKPLAVLGLLWSMALTGLCLAGGYFARIPAERRLRKRARLRLKREFFSRYLREFLRL